MVLAQQANTDNYRGGLVTPPLPKPKFGLTDTPGAAFDFRQKTEGYIMLLFFGYTNCPDECPMHMANLSAALKKLPVGMADQVKLVVHSRRKAAGLLRLRSRNLVTFGPCHWTTMAVGLRAGKPEVFLQTPADERLPAFSPDTRWLAYAASTESGSFQVYVRAFPDTGAKWQVSSAGGSYPMWSRSGRRELFFESLDNRIMVADYTVQGDSFVPGKPRLWSEKVLANHVCKNVDLAPDGKRVVAVLPAGGGETQQWQHNVVFLENFFDELRRRAAAKR